MIMQKAEVNFYLKVRQLINALDKVSDYYIKVKTKQEGC